MHHVDMPKILVEDFAEFNSQIIVGVLLIMKSGQTFLRFSPDRTFIAMIP